MSAASAPPASPDPYANYRELTLRGMVLGALITVVFTASNVYLGLKVGLTFASSIPAAVISMALLRFARGSNILENNMVQTQASAAGTLSSVIFILPGLLMAGYWSGFPFWQTVLLCTSGGILGVIFTIPLRHAMVVNSPLPYPEGVAAAEILKAGSQEHAEDGSADSGIREIALGGAISGLVSFCANGLRVMADSASYWFKSGAAIFQLPMGYSLALLGAGFLVNLAGGIAILLGIAIAWGVLVPYFSSVAPQPADMDMASYALSLWKNKVRFIGAGTIGVAAIWTLITLLKPMIEGMQLSFKAMSGKHEQGRNRIEQDLSPTAMIAWSVGMLLMLGLGFHHFVDAATIPSGLGWLLVVVCTALAFFIGFLVAAACGYMAGLVGSSSSPISGIGIISVVIVSLVLLVIGESSNLFADEANRQFMVALTLFSGTAVRSLLNLARPSLARAGLNEEQLHQISRAPILADLPLTRNSQADTLEALADLYATRIPDTVPGLMQQLSSQNEDGSFQYSGTQIARIQEGWEKGTLTRELLMPGLSNATVNARALEANVANQRHRHA